MPTNSKVVNNYIDALYDLCKDNAAKEKVLSDLQNVNEIIFTHADLAEALSSLTIPADNKISAFKKITEKNKFSELTTNFVTVLIKNNRVNLLKEILELFKTRVNQTLGKKQISITSSTKLLPESLKLLEQYLAKKLNSKVEFDLNIDKSLLGGVLINYEGKLLDFSILGAITTVEKKIL
ncbi:MAG: hypothetical protein DGJ47_000321 [Rickettsiaceae bacterium]